MQFPNGVNKSNLIKLGVLGAAYYLIKGRNNSKPTLANDQANNRPENTESQSDRASNARNNEKTKTTVFTMGKDLAAKVLGKKF